MRAIVLVKQVPDLRAAPVGVRPDGTIDRQSAGAITNPADLHALEAALQLADEVWAVSMGPVTAEAALRDAVALGATRGVLLCDRAFAGSDTWATANAIASLIGDLGGADLVLCGISAIDGETGQVGPEVAERLGWPQVIGCERLDVDESTLTARRIIEGGYEVVRVALPAVVAVAETGYAPRYPSLVGRKRAAAATIEHVDLSTMTIDVSRVGLAASPTKVARMTPVPLPEAACRFVDGDLGYADLARSLTTAAGAGVHTATADRRDNPVPPGFDVEGQPAVWVVGEVRDGVVRDVSLELCCEASKLRLRWGAASPRSSSAPTRNGPSRTSRVTALTSCWWQTTRFSSRTGRNHTPG